MIELKNVCLGYNKEYYALCNINLKIEDGERIALVGEEGSGKTALLRLIAGLDQHKEGEVYINGTSIEKVDFLNDVSLGYLSSKAVFFENKTVEKNLRWALKLRKVPKEEWAQKIDFVLNEFKIAHLKKERVGRLSKSDRRLVQIARLALRPIDILLCDDIEMNKDERTFITLNSALRKLINMEKQNKTVILTCSNPKSCKGIVSRKIKMVSGSIEAEEKSEPKQW